MEANAIYTYTAASSSELSFSDGDTVKILSEKDEEWYLIEINGKEGYAPVNYIHFNKPLWYQNVTKAEAETMLSRKIGKGFCHSKGAFLVRPSESGAGNLSLTLRMSSVENFKIVREGEEYFIWRAAHHFSSVNQLVDHYRHATVCKKEKSMLRDMNLSTVEIAYDYKAQGSDEIDIYVGETITLLDNSDGEWWKGQVERDGQTYRGSFPANYVHM